MRIYLEHCSLQRPFDDKTHPRIAVEAESVLVIIALCESGHLKLISSDALLFEIRCIPDQDRKDNALLNDAISQIKAGKNKAQHQINADRKSHADFDIFKGFHEICLYRQSSIGFFISLSEALYLVIETWRHERDTILQLVM